MKRWTVLWILVPVLGLGLANLVSERAGAEPAPAGGNQAPVAGKDAYGDPLPQGALARLGTIRFRHPNGLCALAISPDGKTLAVAKYDSGPVRLWEFATGKEITQLPARVRQQRNISFSPDGKLLLTVEPEMLRVWDISSGKVVFQMDFGRPPASSDHTAIFAPDGKSLLTAGRDWEVRLWDMATGKQTGKIEEGRGEVSSLRFLPDGKQLAITRYTGSKPAGGMTYLCAWPGGELVRELRLPQGVNAIALSPDGKTLALGGRTFASGRHDSTIRLWDPATDKELKQLPGDNKLVTYVVFTPEGNTLLCFLDDGTVRFWDVPTGKELRTIKVSDRNGYFIPALSADGKVLVTGRGEGLVQMWDIATGEELNARPTVGSAYSPSPGGNAFGVAADGKTLITKGATLEQWDLATGKHLKRLPTPPESFYVALSPDGRLLAQYEFKKDDKIRLRDTTTGRDLPGWDPSFTGSTLAFSADGTALAALKGSLEVCVWEVSTGKELTQVSVLDKQRSGRHGNFLALSEDGRKVAVAIGGEYDEPPMARQNGTVWVWEVASGKVLRRFFGDPETSRGGYPGPLFFSPDGRMVAVIRHGRISLCEIATGKELVQITAPKQAAVRTLAFVRNGRFLASGGSDNAVRLWDLATGQEAACLQGHDGEITGLAAGRDGKTLISASADHTLLVWDLAAALPKEPAAAPLPHKELDALWDQLGDADPRKAHQALWTLARAPKQAVPFLHEWLGKAAGRTDKKRIAKLIKDLDDKEFAVRDAASRELELLGDRAEPALRKALDNPSSLEVKTRAETLLRKLDPSLLSESQLRTQRALAVLEAVASAEARAALQKLAEGTGDTPEAREAAAALQRLNNAERKP